MFTIAGRVANSVDPDQASDLGPHSLRKPAYANI